MKSHDYFYLMLQATYAAVILTIVAVKAKNKMQGK